MYLVLLLIAWPARAVRANRRMERARWFWVDAPLLERVPVTVCSPERLSRRVVAVTATTMSSTADAVDTTDCRTDATTSTIANSVSFVGRLPCLDTSTISTAVRTGLVT